MECVCLQVRGRRLTWEAFSVSSVGLSKDPANSRDKVKLPDGFLNPIFC